MALEKYPISVDRRKWSTEENENLAKGVKEQVQETLLAEAIQQSSDLEGSTGDINTILESVKNLEITPEMLRQFIPKVNWDQLASMYIKDRSAAECEAQWMSSEDPLINNSPWTAAEDNYLRLITQNKSFTDWLDIAISLGTNRTPFQCLARYQRSLNPDILRKEWTAEEDDQLRAAVDLFGEKNWQSVANVLQGRTGTQCSNRWRNSIHPTRGTVGRWKLEEDKRLKVAVTLFGAKMWRKIAQFVPGRTHDQCRDRWVNSLDPKVKRDKWTEEEDAKLNEATKEHGYSNWSKVASHVSGRTDNQCSRRWAKLNPHLVPLIKKARRLRREATVGNFVDRESERPDLVTGDFLALAEISLELEPGTVALEKKRKARQKKSDGAATKRQPKRRRKGLERSSGDVNRQGNEISVCGNEPNNGGDVMYLEWHNEIQDNAKEKNEIQEGKSVAETSHNSNSTVITTNCPQVKIGNKKLKPRRKVSAVVPIKNPPILQNFDNSDD